MPNKEGMMSMLHISLQSTLILIFFSFASRAANHVRHLLGLISQFPRVNPSASDISSEMDIPKLFRQIRSRYKALCSTLGVRPTLQYSETSQDQDEANESNMVDDSTRREIRSDRKRGPPNSQSLDF
jgi:primary-amine oxidase